jgi:rubrerythrin
MEKFNSIDEILDFAIQAEQDAVDLYTRLSGISENTEMRDAFIQFAREEMGHKARLVRIRAEGFSETATTQVTDMKISDYLSDIEPHPDMDYREALILAMSNEKAAFRLYSKLATQVPTPELRDTFLSLAQEEARHKLRFEIEYDDYVLRDN